MPTELTPEDELELIKDIATRAGTAQEIASWYGLTADELRGFVDANRPRLERTRARMTEPEEQASEPLPADLDELWISSKSERIKRAQECADILYVAIKKNAFEGAELATALREFRSYCVWVSNELGQLLHRGSGDGGTGDSLSIEIEGIDMNTLR